ncbi:TPA: major capsid protein [Vibrio cholerae]
MARMGDFGVVDYTSLMALAPRSKNFLELLGVFSESNTRYMDSRYAEFEREEKGVTKMNAMARGGSRKYIGSEKARKEIIEVPFAPLDGVTVASEVEAFRQYGTESQTASVEALVQRKIEHIQRSHGIYIRDCQYTALLEDKILAEDEDGNEITALAKNFSTLWGVSRKTGAINTTTAVNPFSVLATKRQEIIDSMGENNGFTSMVVLCTTRDFNAIVDHPDVRAAYEGRDGGAEYLTRRLGDAVDFQVFTHKGVTLVEDTSGKLTDGSAYMFPLGVQDMFQAVYAPADSTDHVNTISQGSYLFLNAGENWRRDVIESEVSYACMVTRSELICDLTITVA